MQKALIILLAILTTIIIISSCSKDGGGSGGGNFTVDCNTVTNKSFAADVNPIIQGSCAQSGCHAAGSINGPGPLTNHAQVAAAAAQVRSAVAAGRMPQNGSLSTSQKNSIICWIDSGAPNN